MKIDNKGWGYTTMIGMVCVIVVALLSATFFAIRLNAALGKENNESENKVSEIYYLGKISDLNSATLRYINGENKILTNNKIKIDIDTLIAFNYTKAILDNVTNKPCKAYSIAYLDSNNNTNINSYLKCDSYTTKGYGDN